MNMWAASAMSMPVYSVEYSVEPDTRRKGGKKSSISKTASSLGFPPPRSPPSKEYQQQYQQPHQQLQQQLQLQQHHDPDSLSVFLEPAIDGPPSPESIRAQMKRAATAAAKDKHQSHHTTSSGSSSLRSLASADRPSWENALDGLTLSRKSSGRSTSSSMPSRERPESVQIFGKTIFNRRGKFRRESSTQSSSGSSLYSGDVSSDAILPPAPTSAPMRDSTIPAFFSRRRAASRAEPADETGPARKFHISEPYNFQHVTHTQKDHVPELQVQRGSRAQFSPDFPHHGRISQSLSPGTMRGVREDMHFADFSSDNLPLNEEDELTVPQEPHTRISLNRPPSLLPKHTSPPRRLVKHTQSQDHLRIPPPRPPRSPTEQIFVATPPIPPPRISSRTSMRHDDYDPLTTGSIDRPHTSGSFRHPQPLAFGSDASVSPPSTSHSYFPGPDMDAIAEYEYSHPRFSSPPDDANWPLPCSTSVSFDSTLPNVPEEEENACISKRCRTSLASISSLRGSQSVPMLRMSTLQDDNSRRRASGASDTLGRFDMFAAQRALKASLENNEGEPLPRESWEDDIDYCYEHAAEADCDFAWERASLEINRDTESVTPVEEQARSIPSCEVSPAMLTPGQFDLPALSPASLASSTAGAEAITPTILAPHRASNFSLPRVEFQKSNLLHVRRASDASSFKESHGFTLSPSLLIPKDFQQQMAAHEADSPDSREGPYHQYEEGVVNMDMAAMLAQNRVSASTTGTMESTRSGFERHASTASSSTDFTRLTMSTSSLDMEGYFPGSEPLHRFPSFESSKMDGKGAMPTLSETEEMSADAARPQFMSHGSDPNLVRLNGDEPSTHRRKESIQARRGRARTTSLSTPPPPNQYALFPSVHVSGSRI